MKPFFSKQTWIIWITALAVAAGLGAAMLAYTGPNRTRTEEVIACNIILWECQYVPDKGDWRYHQVRGWACSNESKPWKDIPSQPSGCFPPNPVNPAPPDQYWTREERVEETTVTYPPAEISAQPLCSLAGQNGWCRAGAGLQLSGYEPVAGEHITGIEWTLNGVTFAVQNSASVTIPALEGQSDFQYWAHSSFPDTSLMGASTLYLDSQPPLVVESSISGQLGEDDWYISEVDISVSFSDPTPGSGLDGTVYILSGGSPQPFTSPLTLGDGQHEVLIRAADLAGNLSELSQTVKVDTIPPHLEDALAGTLFDGWYAKTAILSASASDAGSGLAGLDVSLDGGAWTAYDSPLTIGDGQHQAIFRARDVAGNVSLTAPLTFKVDATGPKIDLPQRWNIWDTAAFVVRDGGSGLSSVEVILSDPQGRWPSVKRTYAPGGSRYDGQIGWNRRFADDTLAPEGEYRVTVKASDLAGNFSQEEATLVIPVGDIPDEGTIVQPLVEADDPPVETIFALPPDEPKAVPEPVESVFGGTSLAVINEAWQANSLAAAPPLAEPPGILWGAGALAAMAGMSAYYLQKRREEEEAQRAAVHAQFAAEQAEKERQQKAQAKVMVKLEKQWAEEKFKEQAYQQWKEEQEQAKATGIARLEQADVTEAERHAAYVQSDSYKAYQANMAAWQKQQEQIAWLENADKTEAERLADYKATPEYTKRAETLAAWQAEQEKKKQAEEDERKKQAEYAANQAYAALREKGQSITVTAPKEKQEPFQAIGAGWLNSPIFLNVLNPVMNLLAGLSSSKDEAPKMPPGLTAEEQAAFLYGGSAAQQWIAEKYASTISETVPGSTVALKSSNIGPDTPISGPMSKDEIPLEFRCTLEQYNEKFKNQKGELIPSDYYYRCTVGADLMSKILTDEKGWWWQDGEKVHDGNITRWEGIKTTHDVWKFALTLGLDAEGTNLRKNDPDFSEALSLAFRNKSWYLYNVLPTYNNGTWTDDDAPPLGTNGLLNFLGTLEALEKRVRDANIRKVPISEIIQPPFDTNITNHWETAAKSVNEFIFVQPSWTCPNPKEAFDWGNPYSRTPTSVMDALRQDNQGNNRDQILYINTESREESEWVYALTLEQKEFFYGHAICTPE